MLVGDNIYHRDSPNAAWQQEDSHHSQDDGKADLHNVEHDTQINYVLISERFFYFGKNAPVVPPEILSAIGYKKNPRDRRRIDYAIAKPIIDWLLADFGQTLNVLAGKPFDFENSAQRYSVSNDRIR
jgi:hypothetical protein